jgi:hypothetical protein
MGEGITMKKILIFMTGVLIIGGNVFAQGNLIVQGNLGVGQSTPAAKLHVESIDETTAKTVSNKATDANLTGYDIDLIDNIAGGTTAFTVLSINGEYQGASGNIVQNTQGIDYRIRATGSNTNTLGGGGIELKGFNGFIWIAPTAASGYTFDRIYGLNFNMRLRGSNNIYADDIVNFVSRADLVNDATVTATNVAHFLAEDWNDEGGTGTYNFTNVMGMRIDKQTVGTNRMGIWLNGNDAGADIVFGPNKEISVSRDSASGLLYIGGGIDVDGPIYQRGGSLHADYVFEPDYKLESIENHADFMWTNKHLSAIPKASKDTDGKEILELGANRRGIVEELEKAHIYIEQLNERIKILEKKLAKFETN